MRRRRVWKRGSERRGSKVGLTLASHRWTPRSRYSCSSHSDARSVSPNAAAGPGAVRNARGSRMQRPTDFPRRESAEHEESPRWQRLVPNLRNRTAPEIEDTFAALALDSPAVAPPFLDPATPCAESEPIDQPGHSIVKWTGVGFSDAADMLGLI